MAVSLADEKAETMARKLADRRAVQRVVEKVERKVCWMVDDWAGLMESCKAVWTAAQLADERVEKREERKVAKLESLKVERMAGK